jgi:hypothetical protein
LSPSRFFSYSGNEVFTILLNPDLEIYFNSKHEFMEFKAGKVSFHLKEDGNVLVTIVSPLGTVVDLCGIWSADFSNIHLKVAMACTVCSLGFFEP